MSIIGAIGAEVLGGGNPPMIYEYQTPHCHERGAAICACLSRASALRVSKSQKSRLAYISLRYGLFTDPSTQIGFKGTLQFSHEAIPNLKVRVYPR